MHLERDTVTFVFVPETETNWKISKIGLVEKQITTHFPPPTLTQLEIFRPRVLISQKTAKVFRKASVACKQILCPNFFLTLGTKFVFWVCVFGVFFKNKPISNCHNYRRTRARDVHYEEISWRFFQDLSASEKLARVLSETVLIIKNEPRGTVWTPKVD